jgi:hypothetical protein
MAVPRIVNKALSTARNLGPHPLRLCLALGEKLLEPRRLRRLRRNYADRVAAPGERAILRTPLVKLAAASQLPPGLKNASAEIRREAEAVLEHEVDFLGSGPVRLGPKIDWQTDFKSGYRWPTRFYQDIEVTRLNDASDAKVPWELSRGHQLLTLARAACLYEDERFARELELQLGSWIATNPPGHGINWVNPMEVAIRGLNWLWAIGTLEQWRPLNRDLRAAVTRSLQIHGRHIAANLEGSRLLRSNHYLADMVGLLGLGACLDGDVAARGWMRLAQPALEREIVGQVLPDGVGFEASTPYHGLALELFLLGWLISASAGYSLSATYRDRLARMLEVSRAIRHPNGRSPVFGDQDSGRVLPAGFARPASHDNLLDLGAAILNLPRLTPGSGPHAEVAWTLGLDAWRRLARREHRSERPPSAFPAGGLYVMRSGDLHVVVRWGDVGQNGNGGHGHNDLSSYELSCEVPVVVDSGTYLYTADPEARDEFRSARAHNVVVVDGLDMHPLSPATPFQMTAHARFRVEAWVESEDKAVLVGSHDGYRRSGSDVTCRRRIELDKATAAVEVVDDVEGQGRRRVESLVHLAPGVSADLVGDAELEVIASGRRLTIGFSGADAVSVECGWVSEQYGVREQAPLVRAVAEGDLPVRLSYRISPE